MRDVLMMLLIAAFFALCIAYVSWCDRIIGPDPAEARERATTDVDVNDVASAPADEVTV